MNASLKHADRFFATARERYRIKLRRDAGAPPPWTDDPIFHDWRFTNVHREHDRTTAWFREHVRSKLDGLAVVERTIIFRWFNRIETAERIEDLLLAGWNTDEARRRLTGVQPLVSGAYKIGSPAGFDKLEGLLRCIDVARPMLPRMLKWFRSLQMAWEELSAIPFLGPFLAYEIVSDLRHTPVLNQASDVLTWAVAGPGCTRGLGLVVSGNTEHFRYTSKLDQTRMLDVMRDLLALSRNPFYWPSEWDAWEMREVEGWACELAKYQNGLNGQSLKRRYEIKVQSSPKVAEPLAELVVHCPQE
jgi:hypothetical protein